MQRPTVKSFWSEIGKMKVPGSGLTESVVFRNMDAYQHCIHCDNRLHIRISIFSIALLPSPLAWSLTSWQHAAALKVNTYGQRNVWHRALIGGFPGRTPARQQTNSKIVRHTGFRCFESLAPCSRSHCELFLPPFNGINLVRPKIWVANSCQMPLWDTLSMILCSVLFAWHWKNNEESVAALTHDNYNDHL